MTMSCVRKASLPGKARRLSSGNPVSSIFSLVTGMEERLPLGTSYDVPQRRRRLSGLRDLGRCVGTLGLVLGNLLMSTPTILGARESSKG